MASGYGYSGKGGLSTSDVNTTRKPKKIKDVIHNSVKKKTQRRKQTISNNSSARSKSKFLEKSFK